MNEKSRQCRLQRRGALTFSAAVLLCAVFIFGKFIFGDQLFIYQDTNDDTLQAFLPIYQMVVRHLRNHTASLMDMTSGLGANLMGMQSAIFDPFAVPLYLLGLLRGTDAIAYGVVYTQILRIFCAAWACKYFLSFSSYSDRAQYTASLAYAFSAYTVGDIGQHYYFATAMVFFPLLLGAIEHSFRRRKMTVAVAVVTAVCCIWSVYFAYMILLAAGIFVIYKAVYEKARPGELLHSYLPLAAAVVCGVLTAGLVFIPSVVQMLGTSDRIGGQTSLWDTLVSSFQLFTSEQYKSMLLRIFSNQLQGNVLEWSGADRPFKTAHLFASVLLPPAAACFAAHWAKRKNSWKKWVIAAAVFFLLAVCGTKLAGTVMNAFVKYEGRYLYVLFPLAAWLIAWFADGLLEKKKISGKLLAVSVLVFIAVIVWGTSKESQSAVFSAAGAVICLAGLSVLPRIKSGRRRFQLLALLLAANVCVDGYISVGYGRKIVSKSWYAEKNVDESVHSMIEETDASGDGFWRFERYFKGWGVQQAYKYAEVEGYRGVSFYNSVLNKTINEFREKMLFLECSGAIQGCYSFEDLGEPMDSTLADLYGIKYVASEYQVEAPQWELVRSEDGCYLYKNTDLNCAGLLYSAYCTQEEYESMSDEQKAEVMAHAVVLEEDASGKLEDYAENVAQDSSETEESGSGTQESPEKGYTNEGISLTNENAGGVISGSVTAETDSLLLIPVCVEEGWRAWLDGEEVEIQKGDYTFITLEVPEGSHELVLKYSTPGLKTGLLSSLTGIAGIVALALFASRRTGNRRKGSAQVRRRI